MFVTAPKCRELSSKLSFFACVPIKVSTQMLQNIFRHPGNESL